MSELIIQTIQSHIKSLKEATVERKKGVMKLTRFLLDNFRELINQPSITPIEVKCVHSLRWSDEGAVCEKCNLLIATVTDSDEYADVTLSSYAYKRINHFREIINQLQAKQNTIIPDAVMDKIKGEIAKQKIKVEDLRENIKRILRELKYNKMYEHVNLILSKFGIEPPLMSPRLEQTLCALFIQIQKSYIKHRPESRNNFLNYYYVLYKLCELLDQTEFLPYFPMLKDEAKRKGQDVIWEKMCEDNGFEFIETK